MQSYINYKATRLQIRWICPPSTDIGCDTHQKCLSKALLMSTHNICFHSDKINIYLDTDLIWSCGQWPKAHPPTAVTGRHCSRHWITDENYWHWSEHTLFTLYDLLCCKVHVSGSSLQNIGPNNRLILTDQYRYLCEQYRSSLIRTYTVCHSVTDFWLKPLPS